MQVEGINKDSDRKASLLPESKEDKDFCCLCPQKLGFDVKYTVSECQVIYCVFITQRYTLSFFGLRIIYTVDECQIANCIFIEQ